MAHNGLAGITGDVEGFDLAATTNTLVYTCPASKRGSITINIANRNTSSIKIRIARGTGGSPANTSYLDYDVTVNANSVYQRTGEATSAGDKIWVYSDTANVSVQVSGVEG